MCARRSEHSISVRQSPAKLNSRRDASHLVHLDFDFHSSVNMDATTQPQTNLPVSQLESTRFKITQIMESIVSLQRTLEQGGASILPTWPDILAKYNVLLSQTLNLSMALAPAVPSGGEPSSGSSNKPFSKLALHPSSALPDASLDNDLMPLLRNLQTTEVLRLESATVRRLSSSLPQPIPTLLKERPNAPETHAAVLQACADIRKEHDARCDRASRAVSLLREKYEWKARVAVEMEEPEEFIPNPLSPQSPYNAPMPLVPPTTTGTGDSIDVDGDIEGEVDDEMVVDEVDGDQGREDGDSGEGAELEVGLGPSLQASSVGTGTPDAGESLSSTPRQ